MTVARDRLARLLAIRTVRLRVAARALLRANEAASTSAAIASRLQDLRADLRGVSGRAAGYDLKAAAATQATLIAAGARQAVRRSEAEAQRLVVQDDIRQKRAATDTVSRAIERLASATPADAA